MNPRQPSSAARPDPSAAADPIANVNTLWARVLVDELARCGLEHVVISPGSRSAPLVFQFDAHPGIRDHSIVDERAAAFFALGLARTSARPVALLCTTGTAAANYFPAICEAERDGIALIVLTGARPPQDHDCGVQQVMDQHRLYGTHVRAFQALPQPECDSEKLAALRATIARAWATSIAPEPGPVHLDIPFRKPLEPVMVAPEHPDHVPEPIPAVIAHVIDGRPDGAPWLQTRHRSSAPDVDTVDALVDALERARRPLIIAGTDPRGTDYADALDALAATLEIPVLAEPASGLRHRRARSPAIIAPGEWLAVGGFYPRFGRPDLIVHTGRAPLNWGLQRLVHEAAGVRQIAIDPRTTPADPEHQLAEHWITDPGRLFASAAKRARPGSHPGWFAPHREAARRVDEQLGDRLGDRLGKRLDHDSVPTAPGVWHRLARALPEQSALTCSSSMIVRDLDSFLCSARQTLSLHFNRGLNGIDGVIATATGVAAGRRAAARGPNILVIGDVALRHDLGSIMLADELGLDLVVIVIDNHGGEIFDYLPTAGFGAIHDRHFVTACPRPLTDLLPRALNVVEPDTLDGFEQAFATAIKTGGLQLIRMQVERGRDQALRAELRATITEAIAALPAPGRLTGQ
ncbi:MAG: 2-succinyl-5-enolpyruvyl-6-hydroxy-3-cyclohexene-1-carboxylic-acid synthase [Wenzhouxiangellaceae bacterium]|nr:2-succinyl-5-enolpyruvyl-6-hydroxy-3-cyclohexene-1-carboxylic-acid synthase [Wenzhouxiangellaceae bacterium]